ncbi:MAG: LysR substrate-binding domain-containing protein [Polyangiaceae bacterium]
MCAASHPLAHGTRTVVLADLHRHVELTVHDSSASTRLTDARLFGGARVCFLSDFSTKKQAILMGLGFGWMPEYLVRDELANGLVREVRYRGGSRYAFTAMFVHPASRPLGRAGQLLLDRIRTPEGEVSGKSLAPPRMRRTSKGVTSR